MPKIDETAVAATPATEANGAAPKAAKKAAAKKVKAAKAPKAAKAKKEPKEKKDGLRKPQVRILKALAKHGDMTRTKLAEKAPVDSACCTEYLGSSDDAVRAANDKRKFPSLLTLGLIRHVGLQTKEGTEVTGYTITASGKKALEKAEAAE